jgi:hypothetical protein
MSGEWPRAHDRLLAEQCEGWTQIVGYDNVMRNADGVSREVHNYSTDLFAVVRAAEAWRAQNPEERYWVLKAAEDSRGRDFAASAVVQTPEYPGVEEEIRSIYRFGNWWIRHGAEAGTAAEALAWALWKAVTENLKPE